MSKVVWNILTLTIDSGCNHRFIFLHPLNFGKYIRTLSLQAASNVFFFIRSLILFLRRFLSISPAYITGCLMFSCRHPYGMPEHGTIFKWYLTSRLPHTRYWHQAVLSMLLRRLNMYLSICSLWELSLQRTLLHSHIIDGIISFQYGHLGSLGISFFALQLLSSSLVSMGILWVVLSPLEDHRYL